MVIKPTSNILRALTLATPLLPTFFLSGCQSDLLPRGDKVLVEAIADNDLSRSEFDQLSHFIIGPENPFQLTFDSSIVAEKNQSALLIRHAPSDYSNEGHDKPGSLYIGKRDYPWNGPMVRLPKLESEQVYRVWAWIKLIENREPSKASLVLNRVAGGINSSFTLGQTTMRHGEWIQIQGEFAAAPEGNESITTIHVRMENTRSSYLIDDVTVALAEFSGELESTELSQALVISSPLIQNGSAEDGMSFWSHQGGVISRSNQQAHTGEHSILISNRSETWNAPLMPITGLKDNAAYRVSLFARLEAGTEPSEVQLTIKTVIDGQAAYLPIGSAIATDDAWANVGGIFRSSTVSKASAVSVYLESPNPTASYYVDSLSVELLD